MNLVASFEFCVLYNSFEVFDPEIEAGRLEYDFYKHSYEFVHGEAIFRTCGDCSHALLEVWLADSIELRADTHHAVVIPFPVGKSGARIDLNWQIPVDIPEGRYALLYELKLREKDDVYLNSEWYAGDQECQMQGAFCRLTFIPQDSVEAQELIKWDVNYFVDSNPLYANRVLSPIPSDTI